MGSRDAKELEWEQGVSEISIVMENKTLEDRRALRTLAVTGREENHCGTCQSSGVF